MNTVRNRAHKNAIKTQKNYLNNLYNNITSKPLKPTQNTLEKAAYFNQVREGYEFLAGPYRRQRFPTNGQIQERLNFIKTVPGQFKLGKLEARPISPQKNAENRIRTKGKKLLNNIKSLQSNEINNLATNINALNNVGGNSKGNTNNNWVIVNEKSLKGGRRNCTYKKLSRRCGSQRR